MAAKKPQTVHQLAASPKTVHLGHFSSELKPALVIDPGDLVVIETLGGLSPDRTRWIRSPPRYFLPEKVLSRVFRGKFLAGLRAAKAAGQLRLASRHRRGRATEFERLLSAAARTDWVVRAKPPLPAHKGLFGRPTVVNNVISLASVPVILAEGAAAYRDLGLGRSRGTMPIQLAGNVRQRGLFEAAFGLTLGEIVDDIGGGTATGRPVRAVQVGGPLGAYFPRALFDTPFDYEAFAARNGLIGHGGVVVFDDRVDMARQARFAMEFCAIESCGKCTPCRIGSTRGVEVVDRVIRGDRRAENLALLAELCETMRLGSLCALGGFVPYPVMSALTHFPEDFGVARPGGVAAA